MRYPADIKDVTLFFHVLESEIDQASEGMKARGFKQEAEPEAWFPALLEELDKLIPSAGLVAKAEIEAIGIAVIRKGASLPDNRFQRPASLSPIEPPEAPPGAGQVAKHVGIAAARIADGSPLRKKVEQVPMQPMPPEEVAQLQVAAANNIPWPTHQGVLRIDDKAEVKVYQLSDGQRVLDLEDLQRFFGKFGGV